MSYRYEILVPRKVIEDIAYNHTLTAHAEGRLIERAPNYDVKQMILNSPLWWRSRDGYIHIATDKDHFFVVARSSYKNEIITFHEKSLNRVSVVDRFTMSYFGLERKPINKKRKRIRGKNNGSFIQKTKIYNFKGK